MTTPNEPAGDSWVSPNEAPRAEQPSSWGPAPAPTSWGEPQGTVPQAPAPGYGQQPGFGPPAPNPGQAPPPGYGQPGYPPPMTGQQYAPYAQGVGTYNQTPKPGVVPLRPLSLGDLLDGAFRAIRFNPKVMFLVPALILTLTTLVQTLFTALLYEQSGFSGFFGAFIQEDYGYLDTYGRSGPAGSSVAMLIGSLITAAVTAVGSLVATGLLTIAVADAVIGKKTTTSEVWQRLKPRMWPLIGVSLLVTVIVSVIGGVLLVLVIAAFAADVGAGVASLLLLVPTMIVVGFVLLVRLQFITQAVVLESASPIAAIGRAWRLVTGNFWRVLGILLLALLLLGIVGSIIGWPVATIASVIGLSSPETMMWSLLISSSLTTLLQMLIFVPFLAALSTLLYVDIRIRREGLDVSLAKAAA